MLHKAQGVGEKGHVGEKGGSYILAVEFVRRKEGGGDEEWESLGEEKVTVDSGAEE